MRTRATPIMGTHRADPHTSRTAHTHRADGWTRRSGWIGVALALAGAALLAASATAEGQSLERMARGAEAVRLAFPAASNVCGTGDGIVIREFDGSTTFMSGRMSVTDWHRWSEGSPPCETGDVMVRMRRTDAGWGDVSLSVGGARDAGRPGGGGSAGADAASGAGAPGDFDGDGPAGVEVRDLGYVTGQAAADFLLGAARVSGSRAGRDLILAAAIAGDAEIWPELLEMARDRSLLERTRKTALHWLGRRAAREAADELGGIVRDRTEDDEIREAAVFAISQLPEDRAVPLLIEIIRTMDDARVVNRALFWLADLDDARAVALFEEILAGGP